MGSGRATDLRTYPRKVQRTQGEGQGAIADHHSWRARMETAPAAETEGTVGREMGGSSKAMGKIGKAVADKVDMVVRETRMLRSAAGGDNVVCVGASVCVCVQQLPFLVCASRVR